MQESNINDITKRKLYISGLGELIDEQLLTDIFITFGEIEEIQIPLKMNKNMGFGFITFVEKEDAEQALLNMNKSELYGKTITVKWYESKK